MTFLSIGRLMVAVLFAVSPFLCSTVHFQPSKSGRSQEQEDTRGKTAASSPLGFSLSAPHKTGSTFLNTVMQALAEEIQVCHLEEEHGCMTLKSRSNCRGAVKGKVQVEETAWGESCHSLYDQALGNNAEGTGLDFQSIPFIYAPVRSLGLPLGDEDHDTVRVFHHRHPLDSLCSEYTSFGWTHPKPPGTSKSDWKNYQDSIRSQTVDDYVLSRVQRRIDDINMACSTLRSSSVGDTFMSSYEEMVRNFPRWLSYLTQRVFSRQPHDANRVAQAVLSKVHAGMTNDRKHKSHLQPGRYKTELNKGTIQQLRHLIATNVSDIDCLCKQMKYDEFCTAGALILQTGDHKFPAVDRLLTKWGVTDD